MVHRAPARVRGMVSFAREVEQWIQEQVDRRIASRTTATDRHDRGKQTTYIYSRP